MKPQSTQAEIRFRISEIMDWIPEFIRRNKPEDARYWSKELVRIARQLEGFPE